MMALYRPRIFIIEAGGSFSLLGAHFESRGLDVHQVTLNPNADVSLPPFSDAHRLLEKGHVLWGPPTGYEFSEDDEEEWSDEEEGGPRDILGEMEIAARIMITGGDEREDARMTRADRLLIRNAIFLAAKTVRARSREPVLTQDVVEALNTHRA